MRILVDADACPVIKITEELAARYNIECILLCDTNHVLSSDYSEVKVIEAGRDAVDYALIGICLKGDIVVSNDYGVAAMALGKGANPISAFGRLYTNDNIDTLLMERHMAKKLRSSYKRYHVKGPSKRKHEDDVKFAEALERLIQKLF